MSKLTTENFIIKANLRHNNKYEYPDKVINSSTKINIFCKVIGHGIFMQSPSQHMRNGGCEKCGRDKIHAKNRNSMDDYIKLATNKGLKYLEKDVPKNTSISVNWQCDKGHLWKTTYHSIIQGSNCLSCTRQNQHINNKNNPNGTIEMLRDKFIKSGQALYNNKYDYSKVIYVNSETPVVINCPILGHGDFNKLPCLHIRKQGCQKCAKNSGIVKNRKSPDQFLIDIKKVHGNKYDYTKVNYTVACNKICIICNVDGHGEFMQKATSHLDGIGCPKCGLSFLTENMCNSIFYEILGVEFKKVRPQFLNGLELDGFNEKLKLAFEYDGEQHYKFVPYYHKNGISDFIKQQERDERKIKLCKDNNISLIKIPYTYTYKEPDKLREFIICKLYRLGYIVYKKYTSEVNRNIDNKLNNILVFIRGFEKYLENTDYLNSNKYKINLTKLRKYEQQYNFLSNKYMH
jgi:very-short-patch-repair endonuclease